MALPDIPPLSWGVGLLHARSGRRVIRAGLGQSANPERSRHSFLEPARSSAIRFSGGGTGVAMLSPWHAAPPRPPANVS